VIKDVRDFASMIALWQLICYSCHA